MWRRVPPNSSDMIAATSSVVCPSLFRRFLEWGSNNSKGHSNMGKKYQEEKSALCRVVSRPYTLIDRSHNTYKHIPVTTYITCKTQTLLLELAIHAEIVILNTRRHQDAMMPLQYLAGVDNSQWQRLCPKPGQGWRPHTYTATTGTDQFDCLLRS